MLPSRKWHWFVGADSIRPYKPIPIAQFCVSKHNYTSKQIAINFNFSQNCQHLYFVGAHCIRPYKI